MVDWWITGGDGEVGRVCRSAFRGGLDPYVLAPLVIGSLTAPTRLRLAVGPKPQRDTLYGCSLGDVNPLRGPETEWASRGSLVRQTCSASYESSKVPCRIVIPVAARVLPAARRGRSGSSVPHLPQVLAL